MSTAPNGGEDRKGTTKKQNRVLTIDAGFLSMLVELNYKKEGGKGGGEGEKKKIREEKKRGERSCHTMEQAING